MTDAVLIGGGGHAMSCLDAADPAELRFVGYVGPQPDETLDLEYLGGDESLLAVRRTTPLAFVAVGDNRRRADLTARVLAQGFTLATLIAPTARVAPTAEVGPGSAVLHGALVGPRTRIGVGAVVNTAASVDHDCVLDDFVHVAPGTHLAGRVHLGTGAFAGVGVSIIPEIQVGDWAVIGAGSTVIDNIAAATTVVGVPARTRRST